MVFLEYAQVARRVCKVRVMVLEYAPRISGTRHGFKVRKGIRAVIGFARHCFRVCAGCFRVREGNPPRIYGRYASWF